MNPRQLKSARLDRGWSQQYAAKRLGVTQAYLSMLERGRRSPRALSRRLMQVYALSPTALPVHGVRENATPDSLACELARLGYPGFAHLNGRAKAVNPAEFLLTALSQNNLEARVAEGLPWVVLKYPDMPLDWLVREARARMLQNRLGFVVTLARRAAAREDLAPLEQALGDSKLEREDSFCKKLNDPECRWLRDHRSEEARRWNLLSDFRPNELRYVA
jgi:transcriptional regulator with XRE-family HTH domain